MAWSTRELADLAGTTVKAVRHYHRLAILDEPRRLSNGYKQYEVRHLVRLLQIRRLVDLGLPLSQIASVDASDSPAEAFRVIDAELEATIERLQRIRTELAAIAHYGERTDLPSGFADVGKNLPAESRSLILIYSRVFDDEAMDDLHDMLAEERTDFDAEFEALAPDADLATKVRLAETLAPSLGALAEEYPWLADPGSRASTSPAVTESAVNHAVESLMNVAQLEVLYRAHLIATGATDDRLPTGEGPPAP